MPERGIVGGMLEPFAYGRGWLESIPGTQPSAGGGFVRDFEPQYISRLVAIRLRLDTSAVVANRVLTVQYQDGNGTNVEEDGAGVAALAGTSAQVYAGSYQRTSSEWGPAGPIFFPLCGRFMQGGQRLRINVLNMDAGDQLSAIVLSFERFVPGPLGYEQGERLGRHRQPHRAPHAHEHGFSLR